MKLCEVGMWHVHGISIKWHWLLCTFSSSKHMKFTVMLSRGRMKQSLTMKAGVMRCATSSLSFSFGMRQFSLKWMHWYSSDPSAKPTSFFTVKHCQISSPWCFWWITQTMPAGPQFISVTWSCLMWIIHSSTKSFWRAISLYRKACVPVLI